MSTIRPIGSANASPATAQPESHASAESRESVEKSTFTSVGRHAWRSFVAGDINDTGAEIPSEDLGPLMDELNNQGEFDDSSIPGTTTELAEEARQKAAEEEAKAQGPEMIKKSDYRSAIAEINSVLLLGDLQNAPASAQGLQMPAVPELGDILFEQPKSPEELDPILIRYETARKATLGLMDSSTKALKSGQLSLSESNTVQDYLELLQENLLKVEQQMDKVHFLSADLHRRADRAEARDDAAVAAEEEAMRNR